MTKFLAPALAFSLFAIAAWLSIEDAQKPLFASHIGQKLPEIKLDFPLVKPQEQTLPTLYVFWAPWCPICLSEVPHLNELYAKAKDRLKIVAVAADPNGAVELAREQFRYPLAIPKDRTLIEFFDIQVLPFHALAGTDGKIIWEGIDLDIKEISSRANL